MREQGAGVKANKGKTRRCYYIYVAATKTFRQKSDSALSSGVEKALQTGADRPL